MYSTTDSTWSIAIQFHEAILPIGNGGDSSLCCLNPVPKADDPPTTTARLSMAFYVKSKLDQLGISLNTTLTKTITSAASEDIVSSAITALQEALERDKVANPGG